MSALLPEAEKMLQQRWRGIFNSLHNGLDVPPSQRLRAEGMMETLVLLGICQPEVLSVQMAQCYQEVFGESLEEQWGEDWQGMFPFPQIPGFMRRAPVVPSTRD